jgi:hypothetical protein
MILMENDDIAIDAIKNKVRNTLNLKEIDPNILGFVERKSIEDSSFRGHYYTPYELTADIKLIEDEGERSRLILWLKSQKSKDPIIKQALDYLQQGK